MPATSSDAPATSTDAPATPGVLLNANTTDDIVAAERLAELDGD
jgi:hypothetical protein